MQELLDFSSQCKVFLLKIIAPAGKIFVLQSSVFHLSLDLVFFMNSLSNDLIKVLILKDWWFERFVEFLDFKKRGK